MIKTLLTLKFTGQPITRLIYQRSVFRTLITIFLIENKAMSTNTAKRACVQDLCSHFVVGIQAKLLFLQPFFNISLLDSNSWIQFVPVGLCSFLCKICCGSHMAPLFTYTQNFCTYSKLINNILWSCPKLFRFPFLMG